MNMMMDTDSWQSQAKMTLLDGFFRSPRINVHMKSRLAASTQHQGTLYKPRPFFAMRAMACSSSTSHPSLPHVLIISMPQLRNVVLATGLVAFAAAGLAFPFFFVTSRTKPVIDSSKPLPPQATFRGPYVNTGSRDIGPDHGTYPKKV